MGSNSFLSNVLTPNIEFNLIFPADLKIETVTKVITVLYSRYCIVVKLLLKSKYYNYTCSLPYCISNVDHRPMFLVFESI